jgi:hypothetical protein
MKYFILAISIGMASCGRLAASPEVKAVEIKSPVGVNCYAIMEGPNVVGGNCIPAR